VLVKTPPHIALPALLARRPIVDRRGRVAGHELDFQSAVGTPEQQTAQVLVVGAGDHELDGLTGGVPAWIKVTREFLLTFDPLPLAPGRVVALLDAGTEVDEALIDRLVRLRAEGHSLALDDFFPSPELERLLPLADHVKLDYAAYGPHGLAAVLERVPRRRVSVLVGNVDSPAQRDACARLDVELVQGFHFELPRAAAADATPPGSLARLRALIALEGAPSFEEVERVVAGDPNLSLRLLRFANSAAVGSRRTLASVREALVLLGSERVRQFVLLVLLSELAGAGRPALVAASVLRGRLCQAIARERGLREDMAFTAGVLSVVDALLDRPMKEVVKTLPITEELRWALMVRTGPLGEALALAVAIERGRAGDEARRFDQLGDALAWSDRAVGGLV